MENKTTTIKLSKETVKKLASRGKKGDTYETIILDMIKNTGVQN